MKNPPFMIAESSGVHAFSESHISVAVVEPGVCSLPFLRFLWWTGFNRSEWCVPSNLRWFNPKRVCDASRVHPTFDCQVQSLINAGRCQL